jgi:hypothetical protein
MTPKATKKKRWVRARPLSPVLHTGDRQENAVQSATGDFFAEAFRLSPHPIGITELETGLCLEINDACLEILQCAIDNVDGASSQVLRVHGVSRLTSLVHAAALDTNAAVAARTGRFSGAIAWHARASVGA